MLLILSKLKFVVILMCLNVLIFKIMLTYLSMLLILLKLGFDVNVDMFEFDNYVDNLVYQNQNLILMSTCLKLLTYF